MNQIERQIRLNLAADGLISTGLYNGEEHLIVPTVALLGDIVVSGLHAEFPELVPASELAFSLPSWAGRPVIPDHPPDGDSANTPDRLDNLQYGQIFFPEFSDNRLRFEIWLSRSRAENVGTTWVLEELEAGNMVEISIGASIELERVSGTNAAGDYYGGIWRNICGDHIAVGLGGGRGACNLDMGCGALRFMSESEMLEVQNMANENSRFTRRIAGTAGASSGIGTANPVATPAPGPAAASSAARPATDEAPVGFLSSLAARMGDMWNSMRGLVEDTGQSDWQIRNALSDLMYRMEPGFSRVVDVYQDSSTFIYSCFEWYPDAKWYRRTFTKTDSGVTVSDTREEVTNSDGWKTVISSDSTPITATAAASTNTNPCGCHNTGKLSATPQTGEEEDDMTKRDAILKRLAALSDEELEKLVETPVTTPAPATGTGTETPATTPTQVPATLAPTPSGVPVQAPAAPTDPATLTAAASAILSAAGIDVATLDSVLAGEKARQTQLRETLITALSSRVPNLTREILGSQTTPQLEMMAQAAGIMNQPATLGFSGDYSGLGMPVQPVALESGKKYTPPDPFGLHKTADKAAN